MNVDNLIWTEFISDPDNFEIKAQEFYNKHIRTKALDYSYVKNIDINSDYFLNLKTWEKNPFSQYVGKFRREYTDEFTNTFTNTLVASEPDYESEEVASLKKQLNLDELYCLQQTQMPGTLVGQHTDLNRGLSNKLIEKGISEKTKLENIRKYIVYLDDWAHGQVFMCGRHAFTDWKKGDVMSFPWFMPHSTANAGFKPRPILFIAGVEF